MSSDKCGQKVETSATSYCKNPHVRIPTIAGMFDGREWGARSRGVARCATVLGAACSALSGSPLSRSSGWETAARCPERSLSPPGTAAYNSSWGKKKGLTHARVCLVCQKKFTSSNFPLTNAPNYFILQDAEAAGGCRRVGKRDRLSAVRCLFFSTPMNLRQRNILKCLWRKCLSLERVSPALVNEVSIVLVNNSVSV